jgi:hypothetical protein
MRKIDIILIMLFVVSLDYFNNQEFFQKKINEFFSEFDIFKNLYNFIYPQINKQSALPASFVTLFFKLTYETIIVRSGKF